MRELVSHETVVDTVACHKLAGVSVMLIPCLLASVERSRIGIALRLEIEDGVDSISATVTNSDHDSVLIRTHDISDA